MGGTRGSELLSVSTGARRDETSPRVIEASTRPIFHSEGRSKPPVEMASTGIAEPLSVSTGARSDEASSSVIEASDPTGWSLGEATLSKEEGLGMKSLFLLYLATAEQQDNYPVTTGQTCENVLYMLQPHSPGPWL